jgi:GT2 family glycosyltransferase
MEKKPLRKIHYCFPTYKAFDMAAMNIEYVNIGSVKPDTIIVIDNSGDGSGSLYLEPLTHKFNNITIWPQVNNIGVAASWNLFMQKIDADYVLLVNDDVHVDYYALERFIAHIDNSEHSFFTAANMGGNAYSFLLIKQQAYKQLGPFDERFYPAYFEDNDYERRRLLAGYYLEAVPDVIVHHAQSSTMKRYTSNEMMRHHDTFTNNQAYYIAKWGGPVGSETFTTPFGR